MITLDSLYLYFYSLSIKPKSNRNRLLFCINSGRSGSQYLSVLLNSSEEINAYHEPEPTMTGKYLNMIYMYPYPNTIGRRRIKSLAIKKILSTYSAEEIYCETSHMFIKTYFDVIMKDFQNVDVLILRRDLASVLKSFIELGYFSDKNDIWPHWMHLPDAATSAIRCIDKVSCLDQFDLSIAYLIDIEARTQRFKCEYPHCNYYEVDIEKCNDLDYVNNLFRDLRITPTNSTREIHDTNINIRSKRKEEIKNSVDIDQCKERISIYLEKAKIQGIEIPANYYIK